MDTAYRKTVQKAEETSAERAQRKEASFQEIEAIMPALHCRRSASTIVDNFTSYLGKRNPCAHAANPREHIVWLFDNTAAQGPDGKWMTSVTSAFFVKGSGKDESKIVAKLADAIGLADEAEERKTVRERMQPLMDTVLPSHTVELSLGNKKTFKLGPGSRDGISNDIMHIKGTYEDGQTMTSRTVGIQGTLMTTTFATAKGWAVISDIDDTIKKTLTASPIGILRTTFVDEPEPIASMPELYKNIKQALNNPPFWYLSASPYNLYPFLRGFRETYYPAGTMILREASWMNLAGFLTSLTQGTEAYKVDRMDMIHKSFPSRKFVCIGDSTQSDPEAYGNVYRRYPGWVGAIFIRLVKDVEPVNQAEKNKPERFEKAFKDVPRDVWTVFSDPKELWDKVAQLGATAV
ncbi:actin filament organization protein-like protein App1-like protein [Venturia nashicola]|uniref:Actin filament organization protein-like protein App1-like protein n=1 Tax=Venturia nashicola TaxID=86259 RepID=A0A4Z1NZS9_9PEZI|nr:actin filament organization protein-like protein App1-like protein [Venturia nashicola]TLD34839.1 actin filament organization protein-like protein App1-like protein [Venturia nashicola]